MSEQNEEVTAAATGAAAAVAAVQDEQAEEERAERQEQATVEATGAAEVAAEHAESAAEAAVAATEAAVEAQATAAAASDTASEAAEEAYSVREHLTRVETAMQEGWQSFREDMRGFLDERLGNKQTDQPTEVVVTHERTENNSAESGSNPGGSGESTNERRPRHRFGHRV